MSDLNFSASIDTRQMMVDVDAIQRRLLGLNTTVQNETRQIDSSFKNLSLGLAGYFSMAALKGFTMELINVRGEFQKTEIAFQTMLGNAGQAKELMTQMVDLAAKTPFSLQDVSSGAKQLLAFQVPANEVVDTLTRMGNIAAGLSVPLARINLVYGQVKAKGKLAGDDLRQFTEAGIPMVAELAKKFNKTTAEISEMVSAGKIGFKDVQDVLFSMTNEGGMFFNLMEKQSASLSGKISNLGDAFDQMLNKIGEGQEGLLADGIDGIAYLVEHYETIGSVLLGLITTYGAYKAALIAVSVVQRVQGMMAVQQSLAMLTAQMRLTSAEAFAVVVKMQLQRAQAMLNTTMLANPYVAAGALLLGLGVALWSMRDTIDATTKAQQELNDELKQEKELADSSKTKIQEAIGVIRNKTEAVLDQVKAYQMLKSEMPGVFDNMTLEQIQLSNLEDLQKRVNEAQSKKSVETKKSLLNDVNVRIASLKKEIEHLINNGSSASSFIAEKYKQLEKEEAKRNKLNEIVEKENQLIWESNTSVKNQIAHWEKVKEEAEKTKTALENHETPLMKNKKGVEDLKNPLINVSELIGHMGIQWMTVNGQIDLANKKLSALSNVDPPKNKSTYIFSDWRTQKDNAENSIKNLVGGKNNPEATKYIAEIREAEKELQKFDISVNKTTDKKIKSTKRELAEVYSRNSIADLNQRIALWNEALEKASGDQIKILSKDKYGKTVDSGKKINREAALKELETLEKAKSERQKQIEVISYNDRINDAERQWNNYYQLAQYYGKEVANVQYKDLIKNSQSYLGYLERERDLLNEKINKGSADKSDVENATLLNNKIAELTGEKTPFENWKIQLNDSLIGITSIEEQIDIINKKKDEVFKNEGGNTPNFLKFNTETDYQIEELEKNLKQQYQQFLNDHRSFEEQKAEISTHYAMIRQKIIDDELLTQAQKDNALASVATEEANEVSRAFMNAISNNPAYREAFANAERMTLTSLKQFRANLKKALAELRESNGAPEAIRDLENEIIKLDGLVEGKNPFTRIGELLDIIRGKANNSEEAISKLSALGKLGGLMKAESDKLLGAISSVKGIVDDLGLSLDNSFGDALEKVQGVLEGIGQMGEGLAQIAKGDPVNIIAGSIKAIGGLVKSVTSLFNNDRKKERNIKKWAAEVEALKVKYEELQRAMAKALGDDSYKAQADQIRNLQQQQQKLQMMINEEGKKKKKDNGKIQDMQNQIVMINSMIDDIRDNIIKTVLQTDAKDLAGNLADALVEAFGKGEDAAKSLDKVANDVFKNMVKNALKLNMEKALKPILDSMLSASGFDASGNGSFTGFSPEQIAHYKNLIAQVGMQQQGFLEAYGALFGDGVASNLEGAIKGVSEETASIIAGQMNAIRIMQGESIKLQQNSFSLMQQQLSQLVMIEFNTRYLKLIYAAMGKSSNDDLRASGLI